MTATGTEWRSTPTTPTLSDRDVHVWRVPLTAAPPERRALERLLSPAERRRADRFRAPAHRARFVLARARLRLLLSRYTGIDPERLVFRYGPHGKPALAPGAADLAPSFNVSHSDELALYAVRRCGAIGVDLERVRIRFEWEPLAACYFSPRENAALAALRGHGRVEGFFACWTRKEAYVKACGNGLSIPLDQFDATLEPDRPARMLWVRDRPSATPLWIQGCDAGTGYAAALAGDAPVARISLWDWGA
jgi:4'-phosphopantetheinyl transferase